MNNLPIAHTPSQLSGNTAKKMPSGSAVEAQPARGTQHAGGSVTHPKIVGGLPADNGPNDGAIGQFSELLARQIGETAADNTFAVQNTCSIDSKVVNPDTAIPAKESKDAKEPAATAPNPAGDAASILAAMLQQIPAAKDMRQNAEARSAPDRSGDELRPMMEGGGMALTGNSGAAMQLVAAGNQQQAGDVPPAGNQLGNTARHQQPDTSGITPLAKGAMERIETAVNSANLPQTGTTQAITSPALSALMPNMPGYNVADTSLTITAPLGSNAWADEFTQKISWMSTQQNQFAELHLNPPDLGPVDVSLKISGDQATVLFTSPHSAVREAMENALPKLREVLADNGIMLGNATVSDQSLQDRSAAGNMNQGSGAQRANSDATASSTGLSPAIPENVPVRRHNGMVDTFA